LLALATAGAFAGCQTTAMSVEEAQRVTTTFGVQGLAPPPRTIVDVSKLLDESQHQNTAAVQAARARASESAPETTDRRALAGFIFDGLRPPTPSVGTDSSWKTCGGP
jgi:hypothetical protein